MKYLLAFLLFSTSAFALDQRPMSIQLFDDVNFGRIGYVSAIQGVNEGLIFEYSDDFVTWQFLADISPYTEEQWWTVGIPGNWFTGRFFVRARGYFADPLAALPAENQLFWPAINLEKVK